jgi:hypothetical protein
MRGLGSCVFEKGLPQLNLVLVQGWVSSQRHELRCGLVRRHSNRALERLHAIILLALSQERVARVRSTDCPVKLIFISLICTYKSLRRSNSFAWSRVT